MQRRTILISTVAGLAAKLLPREVWAYHEAVPDPAGAELLLNSLQASRAQAGLAALRLHPKLSAMARTQADWMQLSEQITHIAADGADPTARGRHVGYPSRILGEALAGTTRGVVETYVHWVNHDATRAVLLNPAARDVGLCGICASSSETWWSVVLGGR